MRDLILVVHVSLDGFVAGLQGELNEFPSGDENLAFVNTLTRNADAALFGRISYELLNEYWPTAKERPTATKAETEYSEWYNKSQKFVFSKTLPDSKLDNTIILREDAINKIGNMKKGTGKHILIFGSPSVSQQLMERDLIDGYWVFVNPVLFGNGIPLFRPSSKKAKLKLVQTAQFANGEIALHYAVNKENPTLPS